MSKKNKGSIKNLVHLLIGRDAELAEYQQLIEAAIDDDCENCVVLQAQDDDYPTIGIPPDMTDSKAIGILEQAKFVILNTIIKEDKDGQH